MPDIQKTITNIFTKTFSFRYCDDDTGTHSTLLCSLSTAALICVLKCVILAPYITSAFTKKIRNKIYFEKKKTKKTNFLLEWRSFYLICSDDSPIQVLVNVRTFL